MAGVSNRLPFTRFNAPKCKWLNKDMGDDVVAHENKEKLMVDSYRSRPNIDKDKPLPWRRAKKHLIPVMNQLLVQLLPEEDEYKSPIIIPDAAREGRGQVAASQRFLVIAVGPKVEQIKECNIVVQVLGVPSQFPPGVIHKGERLLILVETQCVSVECDENGQAVVFDDGRSDT